MNRSAAFGSRDGFTLLEVLAAVSVFLVGVVSVIGLLSTGTRLHQESTNLGAVADTIDEAMLHVERELDQDDEIKDRTSDWRELYGHEGMQYRYHVRPTDTGDRILLTLELQWREGGRWKGHESTRVLEHWRSMAREVERRLDRRR